MQLKKIFTIENVLLLILIVVAATTTVMFIKMKINNEAVVSSIEKEIVSLNKEKENYETLKIEYNPETVNDQIEEDNIDITVSFTKLENRINEALNVVYNQTKTDADYDRLEGEIQSKLGEEFTEKILDLAKPTINQSGEKLNQFDSLDHLEIKFGEYNINTHEVACLVFVEYSSPTIKASEEERAKDAKDLVVHGTDAFTLLFNLETEEVSLTNYQNFIKSEDTTDE